MKDKTLKQIFDNAHAVAINMNDTFYYACADSSCIDVGELEDLEPVIEKYGNNAFVAYEAIKRGHDPQIPQNAENKNFKEAKAMILDIMDKASEYGEFFELRDYLTLKAYNAEQRKKKSKVLHRLADGWYSFFGDR